MRFALVTLLSVGCLGGAIIDQIAITVGNQAITERDLTNDIRLAALLNGTPVDNSIDARRAAAARLIEQALIRREMSFGSYPAVPVTEIDQALSNTEKARGGPAALDQVLKNYDLSRKELRDYLAWQMQFLRFIDLRFRPAVQVTNEDVEKYYRENVVAAKPAGQVPELNDVRGQIEQKLSGDRVDEQLDRWIKLQRTRAVIRFQDAALATPKTEVPK